MNEDDPRENGAVAFYVGPDGKFHYQVFAKGKLVESNVADNSEEVARALANQSEVLDKLKEGEGIEE